MKLLKLKGKSSEDKMLVIMFFGFPVYIIFIVIYYLFTQIF